MTYTIVGDGPLRGRIEQLIRDLGIAHAVDLVGWKRRPEIVDMLSSCDVLLAPSITAESGDQEGSPVVLMEALAAGVAVVSTRHSGIPELVEDGVTGFLVPERDVMALTEKLRHLADHPLVRARLGRAGREVVDRQHNIDKLNDRLLELYHEVLSAPSRYSDR